MSEMKMKPAPAAPSNASTALTTAADRAALEEMFKSSGGFLPSFKIVFPIETDLHKYIGKAIVATSQDDVKELSSPYRIGVLHARRAAKREYFDTEAKKKKNEFAYEGGATAKRYGELKALAESHHEGHFVGDESLLAIWPDAKSVVLARANAFKTMQAYLHKPFLQALTLTHKTVVRVDIIDHMKNMTTSKIGNKYYSPTKFTQWEQEELTKEQAVLLEAVLAEKKNLIDAWLKK